MSEISDIYLYNDKSIMQQIGKFVKRQRVKKGLTQQEKQLKKLLRRENLLKEESQLRKQKNSVGYYNRRKTIRRYIKKEKMKKK